MMIKRIWMTWSSSLLMRSIERNLITQTVICVFVFLLTSWFITVQSSTWIIWGLFNFLEFYWFDISGWWKVSILYSKLPVLLIYYFFFNSESFQPPNGFFEILKSPLNWDYDFYWYLKKLFSKASDTNFSFSFYRM